MMLMMKMIVNRARKEIFHCYNGTTFLRLINVRTSFVYSESYSNSNNNKSNESHVYEDDNVLIWCSTWWRYPFCVHVWKGVLTILRLWILSLLFTIFSLNSWLFICWFPLNFPIYSISNEVKSELHMSFTIFFMNSTNYLEWIWRKICNYFCDNFSSHFNNNKKAKVKYFYFSLQIELLIFFLL